MCLFLDFGFSQLSFSGREQRESYRVQVKFFSGGIIDNEFLFFLSLDLSGTASKYYNFRIKNGYITGITSKHSNSIGLPKAMKVMYM